MWNCDICSTNFQRLDHFKRHAATRTDILRRHWKSCSARMETGQAIPEPRLGGKEKHACDGCARLKRSCSGGQPCSECHSRMRKCSYQRLGRRSSTGAPPQVRGGSADCRLGEYGAPVLDRVSASTWDLGPQNFYASANTCYQAYSRLR
ncbi:hypothetical protein BJX61DRAFT_534355 [Aspergillus egyptiacus]|nr:hypothetical protein BJX61DRAFT_534355 [Aspergillus egyptiacus]